MSKPRYKYSRSQWVIWHTTLLHDGNGSRRYPYNDISGRKSVGGQLGGHPCCRYVFIIKYQSTFTNPSNPEGVTLMLSMIDSNKSAGGVAPILYSVVGKLSRPSLTLFCHSRIIPCSAGSDQSCLPPPPAYDFIVTTNVTDTLTTCQPWGLTISGGVQPYTVTLAELDSPIITNVTLGPLDDAFTFIDRADPNTRLIGKSRKACSFCAILTIWLQPPLVTGLFLTLNFSR